MTCVPRKVAWRRVEQNGDRSKENRVVSSLFHRIFLTELFSYPFFIFLGKKSRATH